MRYSTFLIPGLMLASLATAQTSRHRAVQFPPAKTIVSKTVVLTPLKDNTLYQSTDGSVSNGGGIHMFAGTTSNLQRRRALVAFDVPGLIPPRRTVTLVTLVLQVCRSIG